MPRAVYSLILLIASPLALLYFRWRARREPGYAQGTAQRFGAVDELPTNQPLWMHCASVGEVQAALPVFNALIAEHPGLPIHVTTMTPTGAELVRQRLGDRVSHSYIPFDLPFAVRAVLAQMQPRALVLMETELWPNLILAAADAGVPVAVINARLTEQSVTGYQRFPGKRLMAKAVGSISSVLAQTDADRRRYLGLGARADHTITSGNLKFDVDIDEATREQATRLRAQLAGQRPVWIAASTHEGEEVAALNAHKAVMDALPDALLILVPRHPQRFDDVAALCAESGLSFARRSSGDWGAKVDCYLADTLGELQMLYGCAVVAFVGGTLAPIGGHNLLEPAAMNAAVICGPHTEHCAEIAAELEKNNGLQRVSNPDELGSVVIDLLSDSAKRQKLTSAASAVVKDNRGALAQTMNMLKPYIDNWHSI